jgi:outer membrane protein OmpU
MYHKLILTLNKTEKNMNNFKKVGLTALAASLATVSTVNAGELAVTGSATMGWSSKEEHDSGGWYMMDKIVFTGSGTLDNGIDMTIGLSIDESDAADHAGDKIFEGRYITLSSDTMGSLTFQGKDGGSVTAAYDDKMPTVYEESWHAATGPTDGPSGSTSAQNMFYYSNAVTVDGLQVDVSYTPGGGGRSNEGTVEYGFVYTGVDGLTIGAAQGDDKTVKNVEVDNKIVYATYAMGPVTVGYQQNDSDSQTDANDEDMKAYSLTYAVNDDLSVMIAESVIDSANMTVDQEVTSIGASYSMGSMSIALQSWDVDNNAGGVAANSSYGMTDLNISFAF